MNNLPAIRKSIAGFLSLLATWGMATAPDGIQAAEWWSLLGVIAGTGFVFGVTNEPAPDDRGAITLQTVVLILVGLVAIVWLAANVDIVTN